MQDLWEVEASSDRDTDSNEEEVQSNDKRSYSNQNSTWRSFETSTNGSKRIKLAVEGVVIGICDQEVDEKEGVEEVDAMEKNSSVKPKKLVRFKKCKPGYFGSLPLDIYLEVISHLGMKELYNFSLVSRSLRQLLISNSSKSLWIEARKELDLPDIENLSEQQYAHLLFSNKCVDCGSKTNVGPNTFARTIICRECKAEQYILGSKSRSMYPHLHPNILQCVLPTVLPTSEVNWIYLADQYYLRSDIIYYDQILQELQIQDEIEAFESNKQSKKKSFVYDSASDTALPGSLVDEFVQKRIPIIKRHTKEGKDLSWHFNYFKEKVRTELFYANRRTEEVHYLMLDRRYDIQDKVREVGWGEWYFTSEKWLTSKIINKAEELTEENWERIKKSVIKLLESVKSAVELAKLKTRQLKRQDQLQKPYKSLLASTVFKRDRITFPLFGDFLLLPSIKNMWEDENWKFSQRRWNKAIPTIDAEVQQHRASVRIHAIKTILSSSTLQSYEELDEFDDSNFSAANYDEDFFNRPTSFLVCNIPGCHIDNSWTIEHMPYRHQVSVPGRKTKFASLLDLLQHQHQHHSSARFDKYFLGHFDLPDPVVFALSAIIEVSRLKEEIVTEVQLNEQGENFKWSNSIAFTVLYDWKELINQVILKHRVASRKKPLPIPTITYIVPSNSRKSRRRARF